MYSHFQWYILQDTGVLLPMHKYMVNNQPFLFVCDHRTAEMANNVTFNGFIINAVSGFVCLVFWGGGGGGGTVMSTNYHTMHGITNSGNNTNTLIDSLQLTFLVPPSPINPNTFCD